MPVEPSGHVFRVERKRGPQWYAKYRLPDGRQVQRHIGPAWTERGRPPAGYVTKRGAEAWLRDVLEQARRGTLPGQVRTGVTFADAAAEWLRYIEHDRERKPSTVAGYKALVRSQLLPAFGEQPIESITTPMIERWLAEVDRSSNTRTKSLVWLHGIFKRARKLYGLPVMWTVGPEGEGLGPVRLGRVHALQLGARGARLDFRLDVLEAGWWKIEDWVAGLGPVAPPAADRRHLRCA